MTEFQETKPLAEELLDTLVDLLFFEDFTIPHKDNSKSKVNYSIWTSGVGCNAAVPSNGRMENNRTEVMRLLLTLASKSMYMPANILPIKGVKAITYLATCPDKQVVLSMLCSFLNTTAKFNPASWRIPYDHVVVGDPKHLYVSTSLQLLLVLLRAAKELLPSLPWPTPSLSRLPVHMRRNVADTASTSHCYIVVSARKPQTSQMGSGNDHAFLGNHSVEQAFPVFHCRYGPWI